MKNNVDAWLFYSGNVYDKKKENGYIDKIIKKAHDEYGFNLEVYSSHKFIVVSGKENTLYYDNEEVKSVPKVVVMRRYEIYLGRQLELMGAKVYNNIQSLIDARNKMKIHQMLASNHVNTPKTIYIVPKKNLSNIKYKDACSILGNKFVMKWIYGSQGKHVFLVDNEDEFNRIVKKYEGKVLCQEYLKASYGMDIRAYVIGGKYIGAAIRKSNGDFRSNLARGGEAIKFEYDKRVEDIALKAAHASNMDICGVDILLGDDHEYYICEVNGVPGFKSLNRTMGINEQDILLTLIKDKLKEINN
ncbi:MAG: RimK family alpha-L-glutamate ligase [Bacilli bacterium]